MLRLFHLTHGISNRNVWYIEHWIRKEVINSCLVTNYVTLSAHFWSCCVLVSLGEMLLISSRIIGLKAKKAIIKTYKYSDTVWLGSLGIRQQKKWSPGVNAHWFFHLPAVSSPPAPLWRSPPWACPAFWHWSCKCFECGFRIRVSFLLCFCKNS